MSGLHFVTRTARDRAFNQGADARLQGLSRKHNPYVGRYHVLADAWRDGYFDVEHHWARNVGDRWYVMPLPLACS